MSEPSRTEQHTAEPSRHNDHDGETARHSVLQHTKNLLTTELLAIVIKAAAAVGKNICVDARMCRMFRPIGIVGHEGSHVAFNGVNIVHGVHVAERTSFENRTAIFDWSRTHDHFDLFLLEDEIRRRFQRILDAEHFCECWLCAFVGFVNHTKIIGGSVACEFHFG